MELYTKRPMGNGGKKKAYSKEEFLVTKEKKTEAYYSLDAGIIVRGPHWGGDQIGLASI